MQSEMKQRGFSVALRVALGALAVAAAPAMAQPAGGGWGCAQGYGPGMMRDGYAGRMMGPGMMDWSGGCGPCAGPDGAPQRENLNLSVDQVRSNMEQWLKRSGNSRLKLGKVAERDADTITADVVTAEKDVLVQRYEVNRHTGFIRSVK
ncbi:hypothetical protein PPN31119_01092 [Pandoraea pnomenusa]|uniref:Uncharacterized protein n=1 Tax=Pandoraea pnomenusa TaxID=93220 RepID=A0ABY6WFX8_9BURK|nr:hypothetical protein [Pandoraea pnomenusa]ANC46574.1 hypothetical protein A6P55_22770 [Pandoraea pnomenusa]QDH59826.1 hypothetical protein FKQ53_11380 [Pandoraea pnomenusa]VVE62986.1 hypothetical protein PPN31119_01092 [Pandoraea pnomenusa]